MLPFENLNMVTSSVGVSAAHVGLAQICARISLMVAIRAKYYILHYIILGDGGGDVGSSSGTIKWKHAMTNSHSAMKSSSFFSLLLS